MDHPAPSIGSVVHYVSHGSPVLEDGTQAYRSACRAAIVTAVAGDTPRSQFVDLCVINPAGMFFREDCQHDEGVRPVGSLDGRLCDGRDYRGGTWHWPART